MSFTSLQTFLLSLPETQRVSHGSLYFSDHVEMFFLQFKDPAFCAWDCVSRMLFPDARGSIFGGVGGMGWGAGGGGGGVVFSSPYCLPEVEWVDALSFKVGAFLKS